MITHDNTRENERDADTTRRRFLERADRHCEGGAKSLATSQRPGPPREVGGGGGRKKVGLAYFWAAVHRPRHGRKNTCPIRPEFKRDRCQWPPNWQRRAVQ